MATEVLADDRALRCGRRERALAQMEIHDLDVLVLGRQANVRYVTGAPQLWVAGTRPFGPTCLLVRETGAIHLLSTWDEGVPEDIPHANLYGISWNPMNTIANLQKIEAAAAARRVGTDALSPGFAQLLPMAFPNAELVDGEVAMRAARRIKTADEIVALRESIRVAEAGLAVAVAELRPGVTEHHLTAVLLEAMTAGGVSTPANQDSVWVTSTEHPWRPVNQDRPIQGGDLVAFAAGVLAHGYIGQVGRTWPACDGDRPGVRRLYERADALGERLVAACGRERAPASCSRHTSPRGSRCRPCRSPTVWVSASTRRWCRLAWPRPPPTSNCSPGWCSPSPAMSGNRGWAPFSSGKRSSSPPMDQNY